MTLIELKYVLALARERHFGKAAASCGVSQPSLSVAIKKLENELGVSLFERRSQDISATPVGQDVCEVALKIFENVRQIEEIARQGQDPLSGPLRIGVIPTISPYLTPSLVHSVQKTLPTMPLVLEEEFTDTLIGRLKDSEIDVAVLALPILEPGLMIAPLYEEELVLAVPKGHPLCEAASVPTSALSTEKLLLLKKGNCLRAQTLELCPEADPELRKSSRASFIDGSNLFTLLAMVAQGLGVCVVPASSVPKIGTEEQISILHFDAPKPTRRVVMVWRKTFNRTRAIDALRETIYGLSLYGCRMLSLPPVSSAETLP